MGEFVFGRAPAHKVEETVGFGLAETLYYVCDSEYGLTYAIFAVQEMAEEYCLWLSSNGLWTYVSKR